MVDFEKCDCQNGFTRDENGKLIQCKKCFSQGKRISKNGEVNDLSKDVSNMKKLMVNFDKQLKSMKEELEYIKKIQKSNELTEEELDISSIETTKIKTQRININQGDLCPECGTKLIFCERCKKCPNPTCGWSACS